MYTFLDGFDDKLDHIQSDVLHLQPFPTIDQAYAHVRREANRRAVMVVDDNIKNPRFGMATQGQRMISSSIDLLSLSDCGWSQSPHNFKSKGSTSNGLKCSIVAAQSTLKIHL